MKYLIVTNDDKTAEIIINALNEADFRTACHKQNDTYTFTIDEIQDIDAIVVETSDIKKIVDTFPLESFHIAILSASNGIPNPFLAAVQKGELKMPVSRNCGTGHHYEQEKSPFPIENFAKFLISYKNQHDSVRYIVKDSVQNNYLQRGSFGDTVLVKDQNKEEQSLSSDVFTDIVMSDPKVFQNIVSSYFGRSPIMEK